MRDRRELLDRSGFGARVTSSVPKLVTMRPRGGSPTTEELGAKLEPELRAWVDRVIVPALMREYLAQNRAGNCVADSAPGVAQSGMSTTLSAERVQ